MDRPRRAFRSSLQNGGAMPELRISTEKVCALIEAAREVAGKVPSTAGDKTTTGDDSELVTIEDPEGSGDYDTEEWDDAVAEAESRIAARDPDYMIGDAALPEYLGDGLEALGRTCD